MRTIIRNEHNFVINAYEQYLKTRGGGLPKYFNPYNQAEIIDVAPTLTCHCGSWQSSATVCILED